MSGIRKAGQVPEEMRLLQVWRVVHPRVPLAKGAHVAQPQPWPLQRVWAHCCHRGVEIAIAIKKFRNPNFEIQYTKLSPNPALSSNYRQSTILGVQMAHAQPHCDICVGTQTLGRKEVRSDTWVVGACWSQPVLGQFSRSWS